MNKQEIEQALAEGKELVWHDPDPIEGNDYTIKKILWFDEDNDMAFINYGEASEAEVYLHEIKLKE